jgi:hypothetical protein
MSEIVMDAKALMRAADRLSGVTPGMNATQIRQALDHATIERQKMRYALDIYQTSGGGSRERDDARAALVALAADFPQLSREINQVLGKQVSVTRRRTGGRPPSGVDERLLHRERQRQYRERKKKA